MAAFLANEGSTCPDTVARMVLKLFRYVLHTLLARRADKRVVNLF